ncbi:MAG: S1 RNA-binding domain-containing protein, partial [Betaproteobacteria bacterium]|nr:S1 RNA-binding domain-containing protein [Betaproteobacteria bacterium]
AELDKPGRDPRPVFRVARLQDDVQSIKDLQPGMRLEGTVSNVAAFGAFIDLGVHCDGLVHMSQLADRFVKDAAEVVKVGDIVTVTVLEVDVPRQRIALSMRTQTPSGSAADMRGNGMARQPPGKGGRTRPTAASASAMAAAFSRLDKGR